MGKLYVVATPIGNLSDFSKRAVETLRNSDLILVEDTRNTIKLLNHFDIKTKMISYHKFNETKRTSEIIQELFNGKNISLVSDAGTPCISDPGFILINEARKNGIEVIGIPGPSAVITSLSISGLDTSSFTFYGFVPTNNKDKKELFDKIKNSDVSVKVIYESPKRIIKLLEDLKNEIPNATVCVCNELTKIHEKTIMGNVCEIYEKLLNDIEVEKGEYVILISNKVEVFEKEDQSIESLLVDILVKNKCTLKEAVNILNKESKIYNKKEIYSAGLNLKNIFNSD